MQSHSPDFPYKKKKKKEGKILFLLTNTTQTHLPILINLHRRGSGKAKVSSYYDVVGREKERDAHIQQASEQWT